MPELPEVETVRRGLEPVLDGRVLSEVLQRRADLRWPLPDRFGARLQGRKVLRLRRRSKWILLDLEAGEDVEETWREETWREETWREETWMVHLGMSGKMLIDGAESVDLHHTREAPAKHDHIIVTTDQGARITYNDARRFGAMDLWPTAELDQHPQLATLGPEPLSNAFNADVLAKAFDAKSSPVKAALLDQRNVAGLGNIYVCEALFRSGIHPTRLAGSISAKRIETLTTEIVATLSEAIEAGGSSLRDYRQADGELGYFQHSFKAYGREGESCTTSGCTASIKRIVQSGRSTFYCPKCQR